MGLGLYGVPKLNWRLVGIAVLVVLAVVTVFLTVRCVI